MGGLFYFLETFDDVDLAGINEDFEGKSLGKGDWNQFIFNH